MIINHKCMVDMVDNFEYNLVDMVHINKVGCLGNYCMDLVLKEVLD